MEEKTFGKLVVRMFRYFRSPIPDKTSGVVREWYEHCQKIPDVAYESILKALTDGNDIPKNVPKAMWAAYHNWLRDNPDKSAPWADEVRSCSDPWCDNGYLRGWKYSETYDNMHAYIAFCVCGRASRYKATTSERLSALGYVMQPPDDPFWKPDEYREPPPYDPDKWGCRALGKRTSNPVAETAGIDGR